MTNICVAIGIEGSDLCFYALDPEHFNEFEGMVDRDDLTYCQAMSKIVEKYDLMATRHFYDLIELLNFIKNNDFTVVDEISFSDF